VSNKHDSLDTVIGARSARRQTLPRDRGLREACFVGWGVGGVPGKAGGGGDVPERRRVFVACEDNAKLVVLDLASRRVTSVMDVGDGLDVLALDPGLHPLYIAAESGTLAVFDTGPQVRKLGIGNAGPNAHTVSVDPDTHIVYLPLTDVRGHPVLRELVIA